MAKKKQKVIGEQLTLDLGAAGHGEVLAAPEHYLSAIRLYTKAMAESRNIPTEGAGSGSFCTEYPPPGHVLARFISDAIKSKDGEACVECVRWVP